MGDACPFYSHCSKHHAHPCEAHVVVGTDPSPRGVLATLWWEGAAIATESQNVRGWKGPLWVTQSNPLPKQDHPEQAAQHRVQAGLEYLQRRRLHSLPGQPGPGLRHPQRVLAWWKRGEGKRRWSRTAMLCPLLYPPLRAALRYGPAFVYIVLCT